MSICSKGHLTNGLALAPNCQAITVVVQAYDPAYLVVFLIYFFMNTFFLMVSRACEVPRGFPVVRGVMGITKMYFY